MCKHDATVEQLLNGEGREKQWSAVMCNLTTQWAVPSNGPVNAGSVREINSRVSPSKNMINTPAGDAAEDEVGAAGSGSVGTQERQQRWRGGRQSSRAERAKRRTHWQLGEKRHGKGTAGHCRLTDLLLLIYTADFLKSRFNA